MDKMTPFQAYMCMFNFLDAFYERTKNDSVGSILGDLNLNANGLPMDPAALDDWARTAFHTCKDSDEENDEFNKRFNHFFEQEKARSALPKRG